MFRLKNLSLFVFLFVFFSCTKVLHVADVELQSYEIDNTTDIDPDPIVTKMIAPYKVQLDEEMNEVIGTSAITMKKARPQSTLGNWMSDLIHQKSEDYYKQPIDFAVVNYGGIRISEIQKGPVTRGKIYELMPFENLLVVLKVKGDIVQQFFEHVASQGGWPVSKQIRLEIYNDKVRQITISGEPIDPARVYRIAIADFVANGGDNCFFFKDQPRDNLDVLFRDAIIQFVEEVNAEGRLLDAEMDHRTVLIEN